MTVTFSQEDLQLFSDASGDKNPLHMSASYASRTSFGQPVVFGVLGILTCLSEIDSSKRARIQRITADFHRPMFVGVTYTIAQSTRGATEILRIFDGSVNVISVALQFAGALETIDDLASREAIFSQQVVSQKTWEEVGGGQAVSAEYHCDTTSAEILLNRFGLAQMPRAVVEGLLWSSYVVGMELPGESALFFRLVFDLTERQTAAWGRGGFHYSAKVISANESIHQLKIQGDLKNDEGKTLAEVKMVSFFRKSLTVKESSPEVFCSAVHGQLKGKVALVLGASRGFGAALANLLAHAGAVVYGVSRSESELKNPAPLGPAIELIRGDVTDPTNLANLRSHIASRYGRLDFLVCSAFPPIPSLRLEENAFHRLKNYISIGTDTVLAPLCVFLGLLNDSSGTLVLISSSALEEPVREWPHYLAAKAANESLAQVAKLQYERIRTFVYRPKRMITDMTNTPMGRANAEAPDQVATDLVIQLIGRAAVDSTEVVRPDSLETVII